MLALDPPLGAGDAATIGGLVASADSGPLRHRYGGVRDLVLGITLALSDGTLAKAGGKVIKNVAGYDLGKLFTGSYGTLGLILDVTVRLHPKPVATATAFGASDDADALARRAPRSSPRLPLEADSLDAAWQRGLAAACSRASAARPRATRRRSPPSGCGRPASTASQTIDDDEDAVGAPAAAQRGASGACSRSPAGSTDLATAIRATERGRRRARLARRARAVVDHARRRRPRRGAPRTSATRSSRGRSCCSTARGRRAAVDPWGPIDARRARGRWRASRSASTPSRIFRPGAFVGGI